MKSYVLVFFLAVELTVYTRAQNGSGEVVYFNGFFQPETETIRIQYYGIPKKINNKLYEVTFYNLDSQKVAMGEYKKGNFRKRNGVFVYYNYSEEIILTANYRKGLLDGLYQKFYDGGQRADSAKISRGNIIGTWKSWYPNGQLKELKNYELAKGIRGVQFSVLTNEYKSYREDGSPIDSGFYRNNQRHGIWIEWIENGTVRSIGEYKKGWKKGTWKYYNTKGKLLYMRRYNTLIYDKVGELVELK